MMALRELIQRRQLSPSQVATRTSAIHHLTLARSKYLNAPDFTVIHEDDLKRMFDLYDEHFLDGLCGRHIDARDLNFRLSKRMTLAGGKTTYYSTPRRGKPPRRSFEIAVSTTLLFETFRGERRQITVSGLPCRNRLEALQRIFEHELVHLMEMLLWDTSSCSAPRFQGIAERVFGHREHTHDLITPRERARTEFGVRPGDRVCFEVEGRKLVGMINRITRRATVLVPDERGERYSDGRRYAKFYVPLSRLEPVG